MEQEKLIALVKKAQCGDSAAMERLLTHAHTAVSYQCRKFMNTPEDAEDMTQEVLLVIYQKLDTLEDPAAFNGWVKRIAATRCMNAVSRNHVELQFAEDEDGNSFLDTIEELDKQKIPDAAMDDAETARMVVELIDALPEAQRICTYLYYYDELSIKEIAELTAATENTVKSRLNYARKAIKEGVLDHEKKGIKLYGLSPLPFLLYYLRLLAQAEANEAAAASCAASVMAANTAAAGAATAAASTTGAATAAGNVTGHAVGLLSKKLIAGIVAGVVALGGSAFAAVQLINQFADHVPAVICQHEWADASCTLPMTCYKCDSVEGEALGHTWLDAACETAKTCEVCGTTEGDPLGHTWVEATCETVKTCQACGTTEGDPLGHTWMDATCETAKTCEVCNAVEGEPLGHDMAEANYQAPATCKTCGYTEGEPLTPAAIAYNLNVINAEVDAEYQYTTSCWDDAAYKTTATVTLADYSTFEIAEGFEALEGYEWHSATFHILFDDENAWYYGMNVYYLCSDYYDSGVLDDKPLDGSARLTVNFNGIEYDQCVRIVDWEFSGWDQTTKSCSYDFTYTWRVPIGYDGYIFCLYDPEYELPLGENCYDHLDPNALIFRFPSHE